MILNERREADVEQYEMWVDENANRETGKKE